MASPAPAPSHASASGTPQPPVRARDTTALQSAKSNLSYLVRPDKSNAPARLRTRAFLRTLRYLTTFLFWRLVRYAKYALVGSLTAAVAGTAIGSVVSGAAFVVAPPGIVAGAGVGLLWGVGRLGWRTMAWRAGRIRRGKDGGEGARGDERGDAGEGKEGRKERERRRKVEEKRRVAEERERRGVREDPW